MQGSSFQTVLDASTNLYKRLCPFVCPSMGPRPETREQNRSQKAETRKIREIRETRATGEGPERPRSGCNKSETIPKLFVTRNWHGPHGTLPQDWMKTSRTLQCACSINQLILLDSHAFSYLSMGVIRRVILEGLSFSYLPTLVDSNVFRRDFEYSWENPFFSPLKSLLQN